MEIIRITDINSTDYEWVDKLYKESFPKIERRSSAKQKEAVEDENYHLCIMKEAEKNIGLIFYWIIGEHVYIEYFAVDSNIRGGGYGSQVLNYVKNMHNSIVLEIEIPTDEMTSKRKTFYEKNGFKMFEYKHYQLQYRKECEKLRLNIMSNCDISEKDYLLFNDKLEKIAGKYI